MNDKEIIRQLYIDLCEASIQKDIKTLDTILDDDYVLIHMTGLHQSKQDYIHSVVTGELKYYESIHESIEISIQNNNASVIGKTKTLASPFGMPQSWWRLRQDLLLKKIHNQWVFIQSQASMY